MEPRDYTDFHKILWREGVVFLASFLVLILCNLVVPSAETTDFHKIFVGSYVTALCTIHATSSKEFQHKAWCWECGGLLDIESPFFGDQRPEPPKSSNQTANEANGANLANSK